MIDICSLPSAVIYKLMRFSWTLLNNYLFVAKPNLSWLTVTEADDESLKVSSFVAKEDDSSHKSKLCEETSKQSCGREFLKWKGLQITRS